MKVKIGKKREKERKARRGEKRGKRKNLEELPCNKLDTNDSKGYV